MNWDIICELHDAPHGLTCEAIERRTGHPHSTVSGNLTHLADDKHIVRRTDREEIISTGNKAVVWELVR